MGSVRLHHPLRVETLLLTPTIEIGKAATAAREVRSEGIESAEIKTQSGPVVKAWNGDRRTRRAQILDLFAEDSWRNVYAGELEVRPPGAPTIGRALSPLTLVNGTGTDRPRIPTGYTYEESETRPTSQRLLLPIVGGCYWRFIGFTR